MNDSITNKQVCGNVALGNRTHTSVVLLPQLLASQGSKQASHPWGRGSHSWRGYAHWSSSARGDSHWGAHGRSHARRGAHHAWRRRPSAHRWGRTPTTRWVLSWGSCNAGCGCSCSSCNSASSLWSHHLLGWPSNSSDWSSKPCWSLRHRNTSWDSSASSSANSWPPSSSSKWYPSNASVFRRRSFYRH